MHVACFDDWRSEARTLLSDEVSPSEVHWSHEDNQLGLFDQVDSGTTTEEKSDRSLNRGRKSPRVSVPTSFLQLARHVACHRDPAPRLRPVEEVTNMRFRQKPGAAKSPQSAVSPPLHCSGCHR